MLLLEKLPLLLLRQRVHQPIIEDGSRRRSYLLMRAVQTSDLAGRDWRRLDHFHALLLRLLVF